MNISDSYRRVILTGVLMPLVLFIIGAYNGVMQTIYRAGVIHKASFGGINYYQGLTMHGAINTLVLITFFAVVFGHVTVSNYLKKEPPKISYQVSMLLMVVGTLLDGFTMLNGSAQALFTFYAPLVNSPLFYIGTAMLIVGSWVAFGGWVKVWFAWRRENPEKRMPLAVLGTFTNFSMWAICTIPVAYEVLVILTPWSLGWTNRINIPLTRMLFWMFGHPLVYFWLLPAYIAYYTILPSVAGGKLYSANAGRLVFLTFLVLSIPIGVHHQFTEPVFGPANKLWSAVLTLSVTIPSFMTAFTVGASLEYAGRKRGASSLFGWMIKLPWFQERNYLFGYLICGLIMFIFGGLTGIVNASYSLNQAVHNTGWISGHFHMTVAGPVFLAVMGLNLHIYNKVSGKPIKFKALATLMPYLWMIGVVPLSHGLMAGGLMGEPRRTNLGMTYTNPASPLYNKLWVPTTTWTLIGGIIMGVAVLVYFISFFATMSGKRTTQPCVELPEAEELHKEKELPILMNMAPWIVVSVALTIISYIPSFVNVYKYSEPVNSKFDVGNPVNLSK